MILAQEFVNDNSISAIALTAFGIIISGVVTIIVALINVKNKAKEAADAAQEARSNTTNISNGFASGVDKKLTRIIDEQIRVRASQDEIHRSLREHLEWHLDKETPK
jgi:Na+/glutamate symporter